MPQVGAIRFETPLVLAPMAGVTNLAFRLLAKEQGAGLIYSEMVSSRALVYGHARSLEMLRFLPEERPVGIQLFGSEPEVMAEAARIVAERGVDFIDINMGCPVPKIVKGGDGAALLQDPAKASAIAGAVVRAVRVPVTVKMRAGWEKGRITAGETAHRLESVGVAAVAVHGRTRFDYYEGEADWGVIRAVKEAVGIAVFGNGDVKTPADVERMLRQTGCDAVMVGRAALGNPWFFREARAHLAGQPVPPVSVEERITTMLRHLDLLIGLKGERVATAEMRKHAAWYLKGFPGAASLRSRLQAIASREDVVELLSDLPALLSGQAS